MSALLLKVLLAAAFALVRVESVPAQDMSMADDVFEMQDEGHFHRKRKYANAKEVRAAMDKRLKSRRHHANSHPRSVKALKKSLRNSKKHASLAKTHEILPFSKIWGQHHHNHSLKTKQMRMHLHGDREQASLLAMARAKVNKTRHKHKHGSKHRHSLGSSLIAKRMKSKFTRIAELAEKSVVHTKVANNEVVEFETADGDFKKKEEQHEQAWLKARSKEEKRLKRRRLALKMGMNQTYNYTSNHSHRHNHTHNHTNHTQPYI